MISTTMNVPLNQVSQSIRIESKKENSIHIPYFFTTIKKEDNKSVNKSIKKNSIENKKEIKK